jgi:hypothetical protein
MKVAFNGLDRRKLWQVIIRPAERHEAKQQQPRHRQHREADAEDKTEVGSRV